MSAIITSEKEQRLVHIKLDSGETLTATEGHPFRTSEGWRDAILLKKGGKLLLKGSGNGDDDSAGAATVAAIEVETKVVRVFNLEVENLHTFFVGDEGVVVHNGEPPPNLSPPGAGRNGAFREAKRHLGLPMSSPCKVGKAKDKRGNLTGKREYDFGNGKTIRDDPPHDYGPGNPQNRGPHFNTPDDGHFDY